MKVQIKKIFGDTQLPQYATEGSAGMDLIADNFKKHYTYHVPCTEEGQNIDDEAEEFTLNPKCRILIGTGIQVAIPQGYEMDVRPRSGLALKYGITVLNAPGLVDEDFRGEVGVILINNGGMPFKIKLGDKIAQAVVTSYEKVTWDEVDELSETVRGEGGFGHTTNKDVVNDLKSRSNDKLSGYNPMPPLTPFDPKQHENLK